MAGVGAEVMAAVAEAAMMVAAVEEGAVMAETAAMKPEASAN